MPNPVLQSTPGSRDPRSTRLSQCLLRPATEPHHCLFTLSPPFHQKVTFRHPSSHPAYTLIIEPSRGLTTSHHLPPSNRIHFIFHLAVDNNIQGSFTKKKYATRRRYPKTRRTQRKDQKQPRASMGVYRRTKIRYPRNKHQYRN